MQNSYAPIPSVGRFDGGLSQLLRGDGQGHFAPVPPAASGLVVPGDAKALAVLDLDQDGWPDFLVSRNNDSALAFHNNGLADHRSFGVRLHGAAGNPDRRRGPDQRRAVRRLDPDERGLRRQRPLQPVLPGVLLRLPGRPSAQDDPRALAQRRLLHPAPGPGPPHPPDHPAKRALKASQPHTIGFLIDHAQPPKSPAACNLTPRASDPTGLTEGHPDSKK